MEFIFRADFFNGARVLNIKYGTHLFELVIYTKPDRRGKRTYDTFSLHHTPVAATTMCIDISSLLSRSSGIATSQRPHDGNVFDGPWAFVDFLEEAQQ